MALPSLILRLEHLEPPVAASAQDDVLTVPDIDDEPSAASESATAQPGPAASERSIAHGATAGRHAADTSAVERLMSSTTLSRWSAAVAAAHDACFVVDVKGAVVSISVTAVDLLGCADVTVIGRPLVDVITLVDLDTGAPNPEYAPRITPLVVLHNPGLARSLMRIRHDDDALMTLDSSSAPIHDAAGHLIGSLTFISRIAAS
jgi:PAS domain-containing protein